MFDRSPASQVWAYCQYQSGARCIPIKTPKSILFFKYRNSMTQHPILVPQRVQLAINAFTPTGISYSSHLDLSISVLRVNIV